MYKFMKRAAKVGGIACLCGIFALAVMAAPTSDEYFFRIEVKGGHGEEVSVSAPLSLLGTLYDIMPSEIHKMFEKSDLTIEKIINELEKLEGEDLVRVTGEENVRIWCEPVTNSNRKDLGFVKIHVEEDDDDVEVNVVIPRGLIQLAGSIIKELGLADKIFDEHCLEELTGAKISLH